MSSSSAYRLERTRRAAQGFEEYTEPYHHRRRYRPIYIYERLDEPDRAMLEETLAKMESATYAVAFSSGMAAISTLLLTLLEQGDEIVAHKTLYGCTYSLMTEWLMKFGVSITWVDMTKDGELERALSPGTKVVYFESPTNPTLDIIDLRKVARTVKKYASKARKQIYTVVDNTFATPYCQRPLEHGIDFVVESLTKNINGFGTQIGGLIATRHTDLEPRIFLARKDLGGVLHAQSAWATFVYGVPTLPARVQLQMKNTKRVAEFLREQPEVDEVRWPGFDTHPHFDIAQRQMRTPDGKFAPGNMIFFRMKGAPAEARAFAETFMDVIAEDAYSITLAVSLGQIRTLIEHPASMTHAMIPPEEQVKAGIDPGGIRISVGIEHWQDILSDLKHAFEKARELTRQSVQV